MHGCSWWGRVSPRVSPRSGACASACTVSTAACGGVLVLHAQTATPPKGSAMVLHSVAHAKPHACCALTHASPGACAHLYVPRPATLRARAIHILSREAANYDTCLPAPPLTHTSPGAHCDRLPSAHTCFNHLLLPHYNSKEVLQVSVRVRLWALLRASTISLGCVLSTLLDVGAHTPTWPTTISSTTILPTMAPTHTPCTDTLSSSNSLITHTPVHANTASMRSPGRVRGTASRAHAPHNTPTRTWVASAPSAADTGTPPRTGQSAYARPRAAIANSLDAAPYRAHVGLSCVCAPTPRYLAHAFVAMQERLLLALQNAEGFGLM